MKKLIVLFGLISVINICLSQTAFSPQQIMISDANGITDLNFTDINGDGDIDIVATLYDDNKVVWYENDGTGVFGQQQLISDNAQGASFVAVNDFTGDAIPDVVSISQNDNKIGWYENDGNGNFGNEQVLSGSVVNASGLITVDLDSDTDIDILVGTESKISWYKNNGNGNFGSQILITNISGNDQPQWEIAVGDLDNDDDMDIISGCLLSIYWYENNGSGGFGNKQTLNFYSHLGITSLQSIDLDKDSDIDVLAGIGDMNYSSVKWYENDGSGFDVYSIVTYGGNIEYMFAMALEIDGDADTDILAAPHSMTNDGFLIWMKNDGNENFSSEVTISDELNISGLFANDLDNDNDQDVIGISNQDNRIFSYTNLLNNITHIDYPLCENDSILIGNEWITQPGSYPFDTLTGAFGGDSILVYDVYSHPNPDDFQITGPAEVEEYAVITYSVPTNPDIEYSFEVENGNILSTQANSVEIQWGENSMGLITATATFPNTGCDTQSTLEITVGTGDIGEINQIYVRIFPNPANNVLFIESDISSFTVEMINTTGKVVKYSDQAKIDISNLEGNIYFVKIFDKHGNILRIEKLILIR